MFVVSSKLNKMATFASE